MPALPNPFFLMPANQPATTTLARRATAVVAAVAFASALGACGAEEPPPDPRAGEVIRAVGAFSAADGDEACDLLTEAALERIYGGLEGCVERSKDFEQGEVKVDTVEIDERGTRATAQARSIGGRDEYTVIARLVAPPGCAEPCPNAQWKVSEVKPKP